MISGSSANLTGLKTRVAEQIVASASNSQIVRPPLVNVILVQFCIVLCLSVLGSFISMVHGYSALLGGVICAVPNAWFAYRSFAFQGARAANRIVKSFYKAEAVKLALTALLFGMTFKFVDPIEPLTLFIAFILVQMVHWLAPFLISR